MSMQAAAYGRLGRDPRPIETQSGKPMTVASMAVDVSRNNDDDAKPLWLELIAFGKQADELSRHGKGDLVSVSGRLQSNQWTDGNGETRAQMQIVCDGIISARTVRPKGGRKKQAPVDHSDRMPDDPLPDEW